MGQAKAWLEIGGRPLLVHVIDRIAPACERIVVAAAPGQRIPELPAGVVRVDDPERLHGRGPLVGVLVGLERLADDGVEIAYLSSCDAVALTTAHVRFMLDRLAGEAEAEGLVPRAAHTLHPLAAALRVGPALARARSMVANDRRRLVELASGWSTIADQELPDPGVLAACNDPEQWLRLRGG